MHSTSVIRGFLIGSLVAIGSLLSLAVVNYPGAMQQLWGTSNVTNLSSGQVYFNTDSNTFWVGGVTSNPVKVGDAAWSNNVTASITNELVSGLTTNLGFLDLSTNACTLYVTNGLIKGVTTP
jgi:hypothetical protein